MLRILITGPGALVDQFADLKHIACHGETDEFEVETLGRSLAKAKVLGLTLEEKKDDHVYWRCGPAVHCYCGKALHYNCQDTRARITRFCATLGELVCMTVGGVSFGVPRHYIALHGVKGHELLTMGFELWTKGMHSDGLLKPSPRT